jgi:hypothetical protein
MKRGFAVSPKVVYRDNHASNETAHRRKQHRVYDNPDHCVFPESVPHVTSPSLAIDMAEACQRLEGVWRASRFCKRVAL